MSERHPDSSVYKETCDKFYEKVGKEMQKVADHIRKQTAELASSVASVREKSRKWS